jgi:type I restriction enzyme, S subunit
MRRLGDCGTWLSGGTPKKSNPEFWGGEIPWVGPKDLHERYVDSAEEHLTELGTESGTRVVPKDTVLIVVRSMALAKRLQIGLTLRPVAFNQDIKAILPAADQDPRFLFFALWGNHDALHALVDEASHGTKRLRTDVLSDFQIRCPPPEEQKRIVAVLRALDDKIDSNCQLAEALQAMILAVFRARFVDPGANFSDSETRGIEWQEGCLADLAKFVNGKALTKYANGKGRRILRIRELKAGLSADTPMSDVEVSDNHLAKHGGILFAWSGSLDVYRWSGPEALINQHVFKVIPAGYPAWFVYGWIRQHMSEFQGIARDKATTMGHIQRKHLNEAVVLIPDKVTLAEADAMLQPLDEMRSALASEVGTLVGVRDTLLPKLISGEFRVPDTTDSGETRGTLVDEIAT